MGAFWVWGLGVGSDLVGGVLGGFGCFGRLGCLGCRV